MPSKRSLVLLLRISVAATFVGHGAFGVLRKEAWVPYFGLVGITPDWAHRLMPLVGSLDIAVGIVALVAPFRALLLYAAVWCIWTAALRPLAGEGIWEMLERAGNYGVPTAFLAAVGIPGARAEWLRILVPADLRKEGISVLLTVCRWTTAVLLLGHGMLALEGKALLAEHLAVAGLPRGALPAIGAFEVLLAIACVWSRLPSVFLAAMAWKVGTELLYPLGGAPPWEFVERGGSYVAPLTAFMILRRRPEAVAANPGGAGVLPLPTMTVGLAAVPIPGVPARAVGRSREPAPATGSGEAVAGRSERRRMSLRGMLLRFTPFTLLPSRWLLRLRLLPVLLVALPAAATGQQGPPARLTPALLAELRGGGLVLACRHGLTDPNHVSSGPVRMGEPATQRRLTPAGERQMREAGAALMALAIPIGEVLTSPWDRTRRSADLMFGRSTIEDALYGGNGKGAARARLLARPVPGRTNRVLMTHQGVLYGLFRDLPPRSIEEGDCLVVRPGESPRVLARIGAAGWRAP